MGDLVNLRQARKRKRRKDREADAAANRALHGRELNEKVTTRFDRELLDKKLEAHRRDRPEGEDGGP